jgi:hypothetical protein
MVKGPWFLEKMKFFTNIHSEKTCYEMKNGLKIEPL